MKKIVILIAIFAIIIAAIGCSGGGGSSNPPTTSGSSASDGYTTSPTQTETTTPIQSPTSIATETYTTIRGRIIDANNRPIVGAHVTFYNETNERVAETTTNSNGEFSVSLVSGHQYSYRVEGIDAPPTTIDVSGNVVDLGTIDYTTVGAITIVVTLEDNLLNPATLAGSTVLIDGTSFVAQTDNTGRAIIANVPDNTAAIGGYTLKVSREGFREQSVDDIRVTALQSTDAGMANLFLNAGTKIVEYYIGNDLLDVCYIPNTDPTKKGKLYCTAVDLTKEIACYDLESSTRSEIDIDISENAVLTGIAFHDGFFYTIHWVADVAQGWKTVVTQYDESFRVVGNFNIPNTAGITNCIAFDSQGFPWIGTRTQGIIKYNPNFSPTGTVSPLMDVYGLSIFNESFYTTINGAVKVLNSDFSLNQEFTITSDLQGISLNLEGNMYVADKNSKKIYLLKKI